MPRGQHRSTPGTLNNREARAIVRRIVTARPGVRACVFSIAQGLARVDVRLPNGELVIVRSEADAEFLLSGGQQ